MRKVCAMCNNNIGSTVFLFNFSTCFSKEIQTDDAQKPVFIGTILHCTYSFWGLRPQTPTGALPLDLATGLPSLRPPALPLHPRHYILDKDLFFFSCTFFVILYSSTAWSVNKDYECCLVQRRLFLMFVFGTFMFSAILCSTGSDKHKSTQVMSCQSSFSDIIF